MKTRINRQPKLILFNLETLRQRNFAAKKWNIVQLMFVDCLPFQKEQNHLWSVWEKRLDITYDFEKKRCDMEIATSVTLWQYRKCMLGQIVRERGKK